MSTTSDTGKPSITPSLLEVLHDIKTLAEELERLRLKLDKRRNLMVHIRAED